LEVIPDVHAWAAHHFGGVELNDPRRTRRLVQSAAALAAQPEKSFPQIFDWNELRGFYRLCDQDTATLSAVQQPHWEHTRRAMAHVPLVLNVHDTTELDYTTHAALQGGGPIGDGRGTGFLQHNSLAVVPAPRQVLGLSAQQWCVRVPAPADETASQRKRRARESDLWRRGITAVGTPPPGCCWVDVTDRAGDDYETIRAARAVHHDFLIRLNQNRTVFLAADRSRRAHVKDFARALPAQGSEAVDIRGRGGRPPRTAQVQLAGAPVWIPAPAGTPRRAAQPLIAAWVIRIWEPQPPAGIAPLEWLLYCSLPSDTLAQLRERRDWYCCRWLVELYHDIEKNGCREEDRRFETAERLEACVAILAVVAVRVLQLRLALEVQPQAPAEQVATAAEIAVVRRWQKRARQKAAPHGLTVRQFVQAVARLGGFLGRKGDGDPGVRALWRGYQRLQDMVAGFQLNNPPARATSKDG
jgi:hypothetical protein